MKANRPPLHVLVVEDDEDDFELLKLELAKAGYEPCCHRAATPRDFSACLEHQRWDLVIADHELHIPGFDSSAALGLLKEKGLDLPFIIVSGEITDVAAVAAMKAGAHDYLNKNKLARLGPAIERELREAEIRRQRRQAEEKLQAEFTFREAIEASVPSGIAAIDLDSRQSYVNPAFCHMVGWTQAELVGARPPFVYWPPEAAAGISEALAGIYASRAPVSTLELRFRRKNEERLDVLLQVTALDDGEGRVAGWISSATDITERKRSEVRVAAEHQITRLLADAQSLEAAAPGILEVMLESLGAEVGELWIFDPDRQVLVPGAARLRLPAGAGRATGAAKPQSFVEQSRLLTFVPGQDLPGLVLQERQPIWITNLTPDPRFALPERAKAAGLNSAVAVPIQDAQHFFGVLDFFTARQLKRDEQSLSMLAAIAGEIAQVVQRRRAEVALRRAHDELEIRVQHRTAQLAAANDKLQAAILERKRLEHELLEITEKERRRIGLDLHDDLGQKLSGIAMMTKALEHRLGKRGAAEAQEASRIHREVQRAMNHASDLAHDLATLEFKNSDLPAALGNLAARARELFSISCRLQIEGEVPPLEPNVVRQLYKIAQEAVTNAIKHGKAKRVGISLATNHDQLTLGIRNNGLPFPDVRGRSGGMGLRIMNYRSSLIGGSFEIKAAGTRGTQVTCIVPMEPST